MRGCSVDDAEFFKEVKVAHVDDFARHLLEADIGDVSERAQHWEGCSSRIRVQKLLEEVVGANRVENLVVSELANEQVLIELDAPSEESIGILL